MPDEAQQERESHPGTEPFVPDFDTGAQPEAEESAADEGPGTNPYIPTFDTGAQPQVDESSAAEDAPPPAETTTGDAPAALSDRLGLAEPIGPPAHSVSVPSRYHYLKWWKLVLVILGVWVVGGAIGLGLFSWWHESVNKTPVVFVALVYVVACVVGGVMLAMVQDKPLLSALAIAVMSAVFASVVAAAPLYGSYYCAHRQHCVVGIIPY